jgi:hypothetical protein
METIVVEEDEETKVLSIVRQLIADKERSMSRTER